MSIHFENTVFLGKQCIEKRSLTIGEWIMGRTNTRRKQSKICTAIIIVSLLLLAVIVVVKSISLREQKAELKVQAAEISAQIEEAQDELRHAVIRDPNNEVHHDPLLQVLPYGVCLHL